MRRRPDDSPETKEHGSHTLRVWRGTVVGVYGNDVFVDLAPRMQGVIAKRQFDPPPEEGEQYDFTVRGEEDGLWALARVEEFPLASWDDMEVGSVVRARVTGQNHGGLELKIETLHAFMPRSQCGLPRGTDPKVLIGKTLPVQVIEVDDERQRVFVSRKVLLERERTDGRQREIHNLAPGKVVRGRVSRIEDYGAFVAFGSGLEGLVHISNLSLDPVAHPSEVLSKGESVEVKVLSIRREGKRIGLGLKQMQESPWKNLERSHFEGEIVEGRVSRALDFGAFVMIERGLEGLLPNSESGLGPDRPLRSVLRPGEAVAVRIVSFDAERERMTLSLMHHGGARIRPEEAEGLRTLRERRANPEAAARGLDLGAMLERALEEQRRGRAG